MTKRILFLFLLIAVSITGCQKTAKQEEVAIDYGFENYIADKAKESSSIIQLKQYHNLKKPEESKPTVSKEKIDNYIQQQLDAYDVITPVQREVRPNDSVGLDIQVLCDGKEIEPSLKEVDFRKDKPYGFYSVISLELSKVLEGKKVNDSFSFDYTVPDVLSNGEIQSNPYVQYKGKKISVAGKILSVSSVKKAKLTKEWVESNTDYSSVEEYYDSVKKLLYGNTKEEEKSERNHEILLELLSQIEWVHKPEKMISDYQKEYNEDVLSAENQIKLEYAVFYIANKEKLYITEKDISSYHDEYHLYDNSEESQIKLKTNLLFDKVCEYLLEN